MGLVRRSDRDTAIVGMSVAAVEEGQYAHRMRSHESRWSMDSLESGDPSGGGRGNCGDIHG